MCNLLTIFFIVLVISVIFKMTEKATEEKLKNSDDGKGILITNSAIQQISNLLKNQTDKNALRVGVDPEVVVE